MCGWIVDFGLSKLWGLELSYYSGVIWLLWECVGFIWMSIWCIIWRLRLIRRMEVSK